MRRTTNWAVATIAAIGFLALATGPLVVRTAFRYYVLQKAVIKFSNTDQRLAVLPKTRTLTASTPVQLVDLGYATFDLGANGPIYMTTMGDDTEVEVISEDYKIGFMPPFSLEWWRDSSSSPTATVVNTEAGAALAHYAERARTNIVASQIGLEETQTLPISTVARMSNSDFAAYVYNLETKAMTSWGSNEIWSFTTPHAMGIVRVGQRFNDRQQAEAILSSLDGTRNIIISVSMLQHSSKDIALALDPILASFQFTVDKIGDRNQIKKLISQASISMRPKKY